jgi:DtxR family Mn-dependent transcriptional regulator
MRDAVEDYIKTVYTLSLDHSKVSPSLVAVHLEVTPAAVTKMVVRLKDLKLIRYSREKGLRLTPPGEKMALKTLRQHRLIELYLMKALGYTWDQVHDEADRLEHVISDRFEEKIAVFLGDPTHDPHGDPIPTKEGKVYMTEQVPITHLEPRERAVISRVNDSDPEMLAYLGELGMYPGTPIELIDRSRFGGPYRVKVSGKSHSIGVELAENVFVIIKEHTK